MSLVHNLFGKVIGVRSGAMYTYLAITMVATEHRRNLRTRSRILHLVINIFGKK